MILAIEAYLDDSEEDWANLRSANLAESSDGLHGMILELAGALRDNPAMEEAMRDIFRSLIACLSRDIDE